MSEEQCAICPRNCHAERGNGRYGICGMPERVYLARAALHMWEEPCISGKTGSGTVFFKGCSLRCVYCQNYEIAHTEAVAFWHSGIQEFGAEKESGEVSIERLAEIFLELERQGAVNINLVTPTHYTLQILEALEIAKNYGLAVPVVYNCGGYEKAETLRMLDGVVDIYLTDFKYMDAGLAGRFSHAPDYPDVAKCALQEMVRQQPQPEFDKEGIMHRGVIVRHLLLPGHVKNAKEVVKYLYETYGNCIYISLMRQYTPLRQIADIPELNRRVTQREYDRLVDYAVSIGVEQGYTQEDGTAEESFIPDFGEQGEKRI